MLGEKPSASMSPTSAARLSIVLLTSQFTFCACGVRRSEHSGRQSEQPRQPRTSLLSGERLAQASRVAQQGASASARWKRVGAQSEPLCSLRPQRRAEGTRESVQQHPQATARERGRRRRRWRPRSESVLARPRSVMQERSQAQAAQRQVNGARQACGGSESRMTWHRNVQLAQRRRKG